MTGPASPAGRVTAFLALLDARAGGSLPFLPKGSDTLASAVDPADGYTACLLLSDLRALLADAARGRQVTDALTERGLPAGADLDTLITHERDNAGLAAAFQTLAHQGSPVDGIAAADSGDEPSDTEVGLLVAADVGPDRPDETTAASMWCSDFGGSSLLRALRIGYAAGNAFREH